MAPKVNDQWQLPASMLSKLLNERRMLKADLSKQECVGDYTLNKRTVAKIDKGEPVSAHTLEKLAKALEINSLDELMRLTQEKICLEIDASGWKFLRPKKFGSPKWVAANPVKVSDLLLVMRRTPDINWHVHLDSVTDDQYTLLQRLEAIVERRSQDGAVTHSEPEKLSTGGQLTAKLNELQRQDSYANLLSELEKVGIGVYYCSHNFVGEFIYTNPRQEYLGHPEFGEVVDYEVYIRSWQTHSETHIVVGYLDLDVRLYLPGDDSAPTVEQLTSHPLKYFTVPDAYKWDLDIPEDAEAQFHIVKCSGHTAMIKDGELAIWEDIPF